MKILLPMLLAATSAMVGVSAELPYSVPIELGDVEFAPGDSIVITEVRGTSPTITTNQTYSIDGTYTLASEEQADLSFYVTTVQAIVTSNEPQQIIHVTNGSGTFHLVKTMGQEGYPHVSFYSVSKGSGFGGVYFGQAPWVLTNKTWSYAKPSPELTDASNLRAANQALYDYLGNPVPWPSKLDDKYTAAGVSNAIESAAAQGGLTLKQLVIDDSEFPPVAAIVIPNGDIDAINNPIRAIAGYEYNGSISTSTCKVFNIVPSRAYPSSASERIEHRLGLRREVLFDRVSRMR
ncbi:MAG TPA: hypothetical protein VGO59_20680 [Verrucomicrobiae bacterium]|jgi:hypothetical protein